MKATEVPKGVITSFLLMSMPLFGTTAYLMMLTPGVEIATATMYAYIARSCVRLLALNLAFIGGIHYGFSSAIYETAVGDQELKQVKYQMVYSFLPAALAFSFCQMMLMASPLNIPTVVVGFSGLMLT